MSNRVTAEEVEASLHLLNGVIATNLWQKRGSIASVIRRLWHEQNGTDEPSDKQQVIKNLTNEITNMVMDVRVPRPKENLERAITTFAEALIRDIQERNG